MKLLAELLRKLKCCNKARKPDEQGEFEDWLKEKLEDDELYKHAKKKLDKINGDSQNE